MGSAMLFEFVPDDDPIFKKMKDLGCDETAARFEVAIENFQSATPREQYRGVKVPGSKYAPGQARAAGVDADCAPPCVRYNCEHQARCKAHKLSCPAFTFYVTYCLAIPPGADFRNGHIFRPVSWMPTREELIKVLAE